MSEFHVRVVKLGKIEKHPNADKLSITDVEGYPVIIKNGNFKEGDLAVYIPVDSIVPDRPEWAFLDGHFRIKAKKLRGVFSMGMLAPLPEGNWKVGDNAQEAMGITKYDTDTPLETDVSAPKPPKKWYLRIWYWLKYGRHYAKKVTKPPFTFPEYTDIEGLRKYGKYLHVGEEVTCSEKIHGSSFRACYHKGKFWVGSHHQFKGRPSKKCVLDNFWQAAVNANLEEKLQKAPGIAFYGEVYGKVQKGFDYDQKGGVKVRFFDAMDLNTLKYLNYDDFVALCDKLGLERVPELYRGPWSEDLKSLSEGNSTLGKHIREGFVVKPVIERYEHCGRVMFKMVGESYLLQKDR